MSSRRDMLDVINSGFFEGLVSLSHKVEVIIPWSFDGLMLS